jgi:hypothetical protein
LEHQGGSAHIHPVHEVHRIKQAVPQNADQQFGIPVTGYAAKQNVVGVGIGPENQGVPLGRNPVGESLSGASAEPS